MERVFRREIVRRLFFVSAGVQGSTSVAHAICPCGCACGVYPGQDPGPGMTCFSLSCPCGRTMFECILVLSLSYLYVHAGIAVGCSCCRCMFESVLVMRLSTPPVHAGVAAACPCGRTLRSWSDVFPCGTAVRCRWTGVFVLVVPALWPRV